jgi:hypothetical protein
VLGVGLNDADGDRQLWLPDQGAPTHQVAAQEAVDRDAAPLAQRIALAALEVRDINLLHSSTR